MLSRQEHNKEIMDILSEYVEQYPNLRFGQLLAVAGVITYNPIQMGGVETVDPFNEESIATLTRVSELLNNRKKE